MEGKKCSELEHDSRNGGGLAMGSPPNSDPNKLAVRIKTKDCRESADNPDHPMLTRAIQAEQAPGSTFKPIVALAGLSTGIVDANFTTHCSGGVALYGVYQHCMKHHTSELQS